MKTFLTKEKFKEGVTGLWIFLKSSAGILVISNVLANIVNFIFSVYLGRNLSLEDFGIVTIINTFIYILNFFISSMSTTVTYTVSYLEGVERGQGSVFFRKTWINIFIPSILLSIAWVLVVPIIGNFLNISNSGIIIAFAPAIFFGSFNAYSNAYLSGTWSFDKLAFLALFESVSKLVIAAFFINLGLTKFVALSIPLYITITCICTTVLAILVYIKSPSINKEIKNDQKFSFKFYGASMLSGLATVAFLGLDVILAKHYLSPTDAGVYSLLSLVGKMIYFFGSLLNTFVITLVSRLEGKGKNPKKEFLKLFGGTAFLSISAGIGVSTLGWFLIPLLFGPQAIVVVPYLPLYALGMTLFTLSTSIVLYELAKKNYVFPMISTVMSLGMLIAIHLEHSSVHKFVEAVTKMNILYFIAVFFTYIFYSQIKYAYRNIRDILIVWKNLPEATKPALGRLNILFFNWRDTRSVFAGGAETYVQSLASRWVKDGHSVTLFTSNDGHLPVNGETDGVRIIRRGGFYTTYAIASIYYMWHFRGKYDVIVDSENGIPFFTPFYAKEKVYCLVHHIHQEVFRKQLIWPLAKLAMFLEKDLMPWVYRNCDFITVSDSSKREIERLHITEKEVRVVHPGIDTDFLTPGDKSLIPTISYVGRLKEHKSVHILIKAFKEVLIQVPNAKLIIAGDGEEEGRLNNLVNKLGITNSVDFRGKVSEEEKREILRSSWVFATHSMIEGWGITTIEANACGTPVIASDVSGLRDSVRNGETGILVKYGDVQTLAEKLITLLTNSSLRDILSKNAIDWSQNFAWNKSADEFIKIISHMKSPYIEQLKKPTVTIGIAAYNEEVNIENTLRSILLQKNNNFEITEILVVSDGSNDLTVEKIKNIKNEKIKAFEGKERLGKNQRLNFIFKEAVGDIIVLFDADVVLASESTISHLIEPFLKNENVGYVAGKLVPYRAENFIEKAVIVSRMPWDKFKVILKDGNSVYACSGGVYALSRKFAKLISFPKTVWADIGFLYFSCITMGFKFISVKSAMVFFRVPSNIKDYINQIKRYAKENDAIRDNFGDILDSEYYIPNKLLYKYKFLTFIRYPFYCLIIFLINIYIKYFIKKENNISGSWEIASSTKK